jgi:hypothetical protein
MPYAIIRRKSGRRHEVDFGSSPLRVEGHTSEETVEIYIEADIDTLPEHLRRFAIVSMSRQQFSEATGARRAEQPQALRTRNYCHNAPRRRLFSVRSTGL